MSRFNGALPTEASFNDWNLKRLARRNDYWQAIRNAGVDYLQINPEYKAEQPSAFYYHLQNTYGIRPVIVDGNKFSDEYDVTDERKFMLFKIKYWP